MRHTQQNLLHIAHAAVGSNMFKHIFVTDERSGKTFDALKGGELSCAYFVSTALAMCGLIDHPHATVATTLKQMHAAGWRKVAKPTPGAVVYWPSVEEHGHVGFYLGDGKCISNSTAEHLPVEHGLTLSNGSEPEAFYMHDLLANPSQTDQRMVQ
ncbi:MAG TPA: NlpC/P60 family protein [Candidatus Saccharimonas sp.]|nr:NlpC/P60 family protein [Candidatus Saccharimonas sp.]